MRRFLFLATIASLVFVGAGCFGSNQSALKSVTLNYWRAEDDPTALSAVIDSYRQTHPNVTIKVTEIGSDIYMKTLLTALAEDRGPDLFSIPNTWLKGWQNKLAPMPKEMVIVEQDKNQQGQTVIVSRKKTAISLIQLDRDFVEVVPEAVVMLTDGDKPSDPKQRRIFGLPFSVDTLGLYYNRDLLTNADISQPPTTWTQLLDQSKDLTRMDEDGEQILQSGVALGSDNIRHGAEILVTLMMQNGTTMNRDSWPAFNQMPPGYDKPTLPAVEALRFYRSFAEPGNDNYAWDSTFTGSLEQFTAGKTAYYFGYPSDRRAIELQAPRLDLGVAPVPQINPSVKANLAHFPVEVVSAKSPNQNQAWDFLMFASQASEVDDFLKATSRPTALRSLISSQTSDDLVGPFASQILTAELWYLGYDYPTAQEVMLELPDLDHPLPDTDIQNIQAAVSEIGATYSAPRR